MIDRMDFVLAKYRGLAYENIALPIGYGATISRPSTVAFMMKLLQPKVGNKILDIGSGSGWVTALLADAVGESGSVVAVEIIPELAKKAEDVIAINYPELKNRIKFVVGNGNSGKISMAPFDRINVAARLPEKIPGAWKEQLTLGGRIVAPVKDSINLIIKNKENSYMTHVFPGFMFVPFQ